MRKMVVKLYLKRVIVRGNMPSDTNWMSTVGKNINEVEKIACEKVVIPTGWNVQRHENAQNIIYIRSSLKK